MGDVNIILENGTEVVISAVGYAIEHSIWDAGRRFCNTHITYMEGNKRS
jgi:hypothetical protein